MGRQYLVLTLWWLGPWCPDHHLFWSPDGTGGKTESNSDLTFRLGYTSCMRVCDESGSPLDATVEISGGPQDLRVIFESRGGSRRTAGSPRNKDYIPALALVLSRMGRLNASIIDAFLVSATALRPASLRTNSSLQVMAGLQANYRIAT